MIYEELYAYAKELEIIDTHEHFISEEQHIKRYLSFFDYMMSYIQWDLYSAGMPAELLGKFPANEAEAVSLFTEMKPFWQYVKRGSYACPALLAIQQFHQVDDFTEESILKIGRELNEHNKLGHYDEILEKAQIKKILNQSIYGETVFADPRFVYGIVNDGEVGKHLIQFLQQNPDSGYADFIAALDRQMETEVARGGKLQKFFADAFLQPRDKPQGLTEFEKVRKGETIPEDSPLYTCIAHDKIDLCAKHGIVAAVHTGVWGNVSKLSPIPLFGVIESHPDTVFDIYHMGMPYVRECGFLGKNYPNAYLNLCWSHCVSQQMSRHAVNEWLDYVPVNKVFGFGGDVITLPEQIWGQLEHAIQNLCRVLESRIDAGRMDLDYAKFVLKLWLYENPKRVYKLS